MNIWKVELVKVDSFQTNWITTLVRPYLRENEEHPFCYMLRNLWDASYLPKDETIFDSEKNFGVS